MNRANIASSLLPLLAQIELPGGSSVDRAEHEAAREGDQGEPRGGQRRAGTKKSRDIF